MLKCINIIFYLLYAFSKIKLLELIFFFYSKQKYFKTIVIDIRFIFLQKNINNVRIAMSLRTLVVRFNCFSQNKNFIIWLLAVEYNLNTRPSLLR